MVIEMTRVVMRRQAEARVQLGGAKSWESFGFKGGSTTLVTRISQGIPHSQSPPQPRYRAFWNPRGPLDEALLLKRLRAVAQPHAAVKLPPYSIGPVWKALASTAPPLRVSAAS